MNNRRRIVRLLLPGLLMALLGPPSLHLGRTAWNDGTTIAPLPVGHADDASRLSRTRVREVWPIPASADDAELQLVRLIERARRERISISIAGARHSMGGHTIAPDGIVIDMLPFRKMSLSADGTILTVQAGALWTDVIPFLDRHGRSVAIMQSDRSFSVGGSLSVNVHGWQVRRPPIAASVRSFRLLLSDGRIVVCSRQENDDLFRLALGGYGLFGVIIDADLETVPNEWYEAARHEFPADLFAEKFDSHVNGDGAVEMAYGRLSVDRAAFLTQASLTTYRRSDAGGESLPALEKSSLDPLKRLIFRGSVESEYGKRFRWNMEEMFGEKIGSALVSRNQLLHGDVSLYTSRSSEWHDIIQEYFVPPARLASFLKSIRTIVPRNGVDLLNVTLRDVRRDSTLLRYADRDMIAVVMLFSQRPGAAAEARMARTTRELVDASLAHDGRYYLPYRPHATREQFLRAYPAAPEFLRQKLIHDPDEIFRSQFYLRYLRPDSTR